MSELSIPTVEEELAAERKLLFQARWELRQAETVEEKISARVLIGRHTQRIRKLERELLEGR